ncbi:hypothetical protein AGLY_000645 [Aphis glycines]|uniref:Uncharacterized protein n=1 Tax=Aphis glycines TaxID=307491 RepID=A0A6G0U9Y2_APHGL|nr:hypothetical protein AGLY_000645 [Aphis glycines]
MTRINTFHVKIKITFLCRDERIEINHQFGLKPFIFLFDKFPSINLVVSIYKFKIYHFEMAVEVQLIVKRHLVANKGSLEKDVAIQQNVQFDVIDNYLFVVLVICVLHVLIKIRFNSSNQSSASILPDKLLFDACILEIWKWLRFNRIENSIKYLISRCTQKDNVIFWKIKCTNLKCPQVE